MDFPQPTRKRLRRNVAPITIPSSINHSHSESASKLDEGQEGKENLYCFDLPVEDGSPVTLDSSHSQEMKSPSFTPRAPCRDVSISHNVCIVSTAKDAAGIGDLSSASDSSTIAPNPCSKLLTWPLVAFSDRSFAKEPSLEARDLSFSSDSTSFVGRNPCVKLLLKPAVAMHDCSFTKNQSLETGSLSVNSDSTLNLPNPCLKLSSRPDPVLTPMSFSNDPSSEDLSTISDKTYIQSNPHLKFSSRYGAALSPMSLSMEPSSVEGGLSINSDQTFTAPNPCLKLSIRPATALPNESFVKEPSLLVKDTSSSSERTPVGLKPVGKFKPFPDSPMECEEDRSVRSDSSCNAEKRFSLSLERNNTTMSDTLRSEEPHCLVNDSSSSLKRNMESKRLMRPMCNPRRFTDFSLAKESTMEVEGLFSPSQDSPSLRQPNLKRKHVSKPLSDMSLAEDSSSHSQDLQSSRHELNCTQCSNISRTPVQKKLFPVNKKGRKISDFSRCSESSENNSTSQGSRTLPEKSSHRAGKDKKLFLQKSHNEELPSFSSADSEGRAQNDTTISPEGHLENKLQNCEDPEGISLLISSLSTLKGKMILQRKDKRKSFSDLSCQSDSPKQNVSQKNRSLSERNSLRIKLANKMLFQINTHRTVPSFSYAESEESKLISSSRSTESTSHEETSSSSDNETSEKDEDSENEIDLSGLSEAKSESYGEREKTSEIVSSKSDYLALSQPSVSSNFSKDSLSLTMKRKRRSATCEQFTDESEGGDTFNNLRFRRTPKLSTGLSSQNKSAIMHLQRCPTDTPLNEMRKSRKESITLSAEADAITNILSSTNTHVQGVEVEMSAPRRRSSRCQDMNLPDSSIGAECTINQTPVREHVLLLKQPKFRELTLPSFSLAESELHEEDSIVRTEKSSTEEDSENESSSSLEEETNEEEKITDSSEEENSKNDEEISRHAEVMESLIISPAMPLSNSEFGGECGKSGIVEEITRPADVMESSIVSPTMPNTSEEQSFNETCVRAPGVSACIVIEAVQLIKAHKRKLAEEKEMALTDPFYAKLVQIRAENAKTLEEQRIWGSQFVKAPRTVKKTSTRTRRYTVKLYKPAYWANKRLYDHLKKKLYPHYGLNHILQAEEVVKVLYETEKKVVKSNSYEKRAVDRLKKVLAQNKIIVTTYDFYSFARSFMPHEFQLKVIPMVQPFTNIVWPPKCSSLKESDPILK